MLQLLGLETRFDRSVQTAVAYSGAALILAALLVTFGPAAVDQAAHSHLQEIFNSHGFVLWDNSWYLGRYSFVNYSFAFYVLAYLLGLKVVAAVSVALSVAIISVLTDRYFPGSFPGYRRLSLMVVPFMTLTGAWPFLLGMTFMLLTLLVYGARRRFLFAVGTVLVLLSSPLALIALILVVVAAEVTNSLGAADGAWRIFIRRLLSNYYLWVVAALALIQLLSIRAFPDHGFYPYWVSDLIEVELFCAICLFLVPKGRRYSTGLRVLIVGYGLINVAAFFMRSNLGSNAARIVDFSFPVLVALVSLRDFRLRAPVFALLALALIWNLMPLSQIMSVSIYQTSNASFWEKLRPVLSRSLVPGSRVELVDTANHQGDYYLPKMGFPIVRGWFRQDDFPQNALLYGSPPLSRKSYLNWLEGSGASLVVLPPGPYDFSASAEANLIASGTSGLKLLAHVGESKIYLVPGSPTVVRSPGGAYLPAKIGFDSLSFVAPKSGSYTLSLFYSPYFNVSGGKICANARGMTTWKISKPGTHRLVFGLTFGRVASVLLGHTSGPCS